MKIIEYSDLHLEFGTNFAPPKDSDADLMILAGDICILNNFEPLDKFLKDWKKPVLYIAGNHEYYTKRPMVEGYLHLLHHLNLFHPNLIFLQDQGITINGVNFFGGTMWTDFNNSNHEAMMLAHRNMNDFRLIKNDDERLIPDETVLFHKIYIMNLINWFKKDLAGPRVVISHHAPCTNPNGFHKGSELQPAYNSLDMIPIIEKYQPELWFYGHTHEPDDQMIGKTRILSNPRGYPTQNGNAECKKFDPKGLEIIVCD